MSWPRSARIAIALLDHFVPGNAPLAGDLIEGYGRHHSRMWLWWQVLGAIGTATFERSREIRPIQLVDLQPADAVERSQRIDRRFHAVNLSSSPLSDIGGLGLVLLAVHVTLATPGLWWVLLASILAGIVLGIVLIAWHARRPSTAGQSTSVRPW